MEMGPIMQIAVDGNTASLIYYMFMTPKNDPGKTIKIIVTEYNTFGVVNGELMVTRLLARSACILRNLSKYCYFFKSVISLTIR